MKSKKKLIEERFISRKQFLVGAGTTLALPTLVSLMPRAMAQAASQKKLRLGLFGSVFGMNNINIAPYLNDNFNPPDSATSSKATAVSSYNGESIPRIKATALSQLSGLNQLSDVIDSAFNPYRSEMTFLRGLDQMTVSGHPKGFFSGSSSNEGTGGGLISDGRSIDVIISESAAFKASFRGSNAVVRVSNYGQSADDDFFYDRNKSGSGFASGFDNCKRFSPVVNDRKLFDSLFAGLGSGGGGSTPPPTTVDRRKLIIDLIKPDLDALSGHNRISNVDKQTLAQFSEGIYQIETNLVAPPVATASCSKPNAYNYQSANDQEPANREQYWKNISEMMVIAFQCDISRILCGQLSYKQPAGFSDAHHSIDGSSANEYGSLEQRLWLTYLAKYLANGLKNVRDADGSTILDNTLLVWHNEHSGRNLHLGNNVPCVTFGGLGGAVKKGYLIDYLQKTGDNLGIADQYRGYPAKMLMVGIMEAMGVTDAEIQREGSGGKFGTWPGDVSALYTNSYFGSHHNKTLPYFFNG